LNPDLGPIRVLPGRLSVSRTFGDPHAKVEQFGGNPRVVIAVPEITHFKLQDTQHDFIIMGCDGIFDKLSTEDVVREVWLPLQQTDPANFTSAVSGMGSVNEICGSSAERIIRASMIKESVDNLSVVMIGFKNFAKQIERLASQTKQSKSEASKPGIMLPSASSNKPSSS
jgi:protein phosphatase PTC2/3